MRFFLKRLLIAVAFVAVTCSRLRASAGPAVANDRCPVDAEERGAAAMIASLARTIEA